MQAIVTKYLAPTNFKGTRVKAECAAGSLVMQWEYELGVEGNHYAVAECLQVNLGWVGKDYGVLKGGTMKNGDYCWVMVKGE